MSKDVVIVGGSIAGLMCGIMLKNHGHNVTILERAISDDRHGYDTGIKIGPDVLDFLSKHCHASREFKITCKAPMKFNIEGKPTPEHSQSMTSTNWSLFVSILRANFDGITSKAVPTAPELDQGNSVAAYRHGAKVVDIEEVGSSLQVHFEDATHGGTHSVTSDLVIVADGSTSLLRKMLLPSVERKYAGYVSWRGTVQEEAVLDKEASWKYAGKFVFHRMYRNYILHYTIPTGDGSLDPGKRLHNWIWYRKVGENSQEMKDIFTDIHGKEHAGTVPRGKLRPEIFEKLKALASTTMPPEYANILSSTPNPFVSKVYDVSSPRAVFFDGKLFLVGDAKITIRPNAGMSTTNAAHDCNKLEEVIQGKITPKHWEKAVLRYGAAQQGFAMVIAAFGLESKIVAVWRVIQWLLLLLRQKFRIA